MAIMVWPLGVHTDADVAVSKPAAPLRVLSALPRDVLDMILQCLVGWDLLQLADVSRVFHEELLVDAAHWAAHVAQKPQHDRKSLTLMSTKDAKTQYASYRSFRFRGQNLESMQRGDRGACIEALRFLPTSSQRDGQLFVPLAPQRFAFDVWFSLNSSTRIDDSNSANNFLGGIILGAQSARWQDAMVWADYHQQFVHVDTNCNLFCSVVGDKNVVTSAKLELHRWYHLALVFDVDHERVYLNGELVKTTQGALHRDWRSLYFMQLGTGCISAGSTGSPSAKVSGWYPLNGQIDEFRMWEEPLSPQMIQRLAHDGEVASTPASSLTKCDTAAHLGPVERVRCSRPRENTSVVWE